MTEGTQPQEGFEKAQESQEVSEARQSLEKAAIEPAAEIQSREELTIPDAENLEKEVKAAVDAIPEAAEVKPAEITLEAAVEEGTVTIDAAEPAADQGPGTEDGKDVAEVLPGTSPEGDDSPPRSDDKDTVEPMFPATAYGGSDIFADSIDVSKTPAEGTGAEDLIEIPVQVASEGTPASDDDHSVEMTGAQPGEVRGFTPEESGSQTYEFTTDGQTGTQTVEGRVESVEGVEDALPEGAEAETLPELSPKGEEIASPLSSDQEESLAGVAGDSAGGQSGGLEQTAEPSLDEDSAGEIDGSTAKTIRNVPSQGMGLPIDDDSGGDSGNDDGTSEDSDDGDGDIPPAPPSPDTGSDTGVSPSLPGSGPAAVVPDVGGERQVAGDPAAEITGRPEAETEDQTPDYDPKSGIRGEESLEAEASEKINIESIQEKTPIDQADQTDPEGTEEYDLPGPEPQPEDFITGYDEDGNPIIDYAAYTSAMQDWYRKTHSVGPVVSGDNIGSSGHDVA